MQSAIAQRGLSSRKSSTTHNAAITFYIAVGCFGLSAAFNGLWLERNGPKLAAVVDATIFFLGNMIAVIGIYAEIVALLYFGYGVLGGAGLGLCYISPVFALQKWFPDRRGLAAGFAVCGFGAGSIILAKIPQPLIAAVGLPLTFVGSKSVAWTCTRNRVAASEKQKIGQDDGTLEVCSGFKDPRINMVLSSAIFSTEYRMIYIIFGNSIVGLVFLSRLANIVKDIFGKDEAVAATIVAINGGFNLGRRLFFSTVSDRLGRKNPFFVMLCSQVIILATLPIIMKKRVYWAFLLVIWISTAYYGSGFGCIPAFLCDMFGPSNIGALHGIILTA
ncbi:hypothetical protein BGX34_009410 [Mortierella sp. NVP85]|nr:hypothetical protein BGX34_009410 [Mortierella sp. NVP85]